MERNKWSIKIFEILLTLGLLISFPQNLSALSIMVDDVECVYEYAFYEGDLVSGNFVVVDHGEWEFRGGLWSSDLAGIDLVVTSQGGNTVYTVKETFGNKFEFKAPRAGMYKFCFHNPQKIPEHVSFYIHIGHIPNEHNLAKDDHMYPMHVKIAELREALESVTAEQKYLKAGESRRRHTNESTRRRLTFYTVAGYISLACASAAQVVYIRRLFSKWVAYSRV